MRLPTFDSGFSTPRGRAFTLIEMIGVMAIMGILAAIVVPPMISKIEEAGMVNEDAVLETIAEALVRGIRTYQKFPNPNVAPDDANFGWVTLAEKFYPSGANALRYVFPKINGFELTERRVYLDPDLMSYLNKNGFSSSSAGFPSSDTDGDSIPDLDEMNFRMYIVSSSKPDLTLACPRNGSSAQPSGSTYNLTLINDLLNWVKAYQAPGTANYGSLIVPKTIANWSSVDAANSKRGEYVHVKIVDLRNLLNRVILNDYHNPLSAVGPNAGFAYTPGTSGEESKTINGYLFKWENDFNANGILDYGGKNYAESGTGDLWWTKISTFDKAKSEPVGLTSNERFWTKSISMEPQSRGTRIPIALFTQKEAGDKDPSTGKNMYRIARFSFDDLTGSYFDAKAPYGPFFKIGTGVTNRVTTYGNPSGVGLSDELSQQDTQDFYVFEGTPVTLFSADASKGSATNGITYPIKSNPTRFYYSQGTWTQQE